MAETASEFAGQPDVGKDQKRGLEEGDFDQMPGKDLSGGISERRRRRLSSHSARKILANSMREATPSSKKRGRGGWTRKCETRDESSTERKGEKVMSYFGVGNFGAWSVASRGEKREKENGIWGNASVVSFNVRTVEDTLESAEDRRNLSEGSYPGENVSQEIARCGIRPQSGSAFTGWQVKIYGSYFVRPRRNTRTPKKKTAE